MTVSKFERGIAVPRDATVLQKLAAAARAAALFAERYNCEAGPVRAIVDQLVRAAEVSGGIGPGWYHELQARVKALMEEREQRGER